MYWLLIYIDGQGIEKVRSGINGTVLDVLFFTSPMYGLLVGSQCSRYCQEIIDSVSREFNRIYDLFIARHPSFWEHGGRISIFGHSLGSVLSYDVLSHQVRHMLPAPLILTCKKPGEHGERLHGAPSQQEAEILALEVSSSEHV